MRYFESVLINLQRFQRERNGDVIATVLDGQGGTEDVRLSGGDAAEVVRTWNLSLFDLWRYEQWGGAFPTPASIPVEVNDPRHS